MLKSKSNIRYQRILNVLLTILTLCMILPIVLLFMSSITDEAELLRNGYSFIPGKFGIEGYKYIMSNAATIFKAYGLTFVVTAVGTALSLLLTLLISFPLSIRKLPGRRVISFFVLFTMLFNGGLVPTYIMWTSMFHIRNTIWAYLLPNLLLGAMNVILMRTYFTNSIPEALYEAAEIDGAGYLTIFYKIVIPLGKPIIVTISMFTGLNYWNDWTNGLYYVNDPKLYTIQVLLTKMIENIKALQSGSSSIGSVGNIPAISVRMAIAFIAILPILCLYPFLQKYFEKGIMIGAVKG